MLNVSAFEGGPGSAGTGQEAAIGDQSKLRVGADVDRGDWNSSQNEALHRLAALGGALQIPRDAVNHAMDLRIIVEVFVVVVIGGLGSLGGAIWGGLIIGQVISFVSLLASDWSNVAIFITMLLILLVRTRGLFGEAGRL